MKKSTSLLAVGGLFLAITIGPLRSGEQKERPGCVPDKIQKSEQLKKDSCETQPNVSTEVCINAARKNGKQS
ncbi:MAG: hypothetical protein HRU40_12420 [Saprospiraceae bacterium]|nr:hypothetical protein [Saprospiraceae bacterium]